MTTDELHLDFKGLEADLIKDVDARLQAFEERVKGSLVSQDVRLGNLDQRMDRVMEMVRLTTENVDKLVLSVRGDPAYGVRGMVGDIADARAKFSIFETDCAKCRQDVKSKVDQGKGMLSFAHVLWILFGGAIVAYLTAHAK